MNKLRKNDEVIVIAGKDKGKRGRIVSMHGDRAIVSGVNQVKKHVKPNPQLDVKGGIITKEAPIQLSNLAIFNSTSEKADRVGFKVKEDGNKVRVFKSNGEEVGVA